MSAVFRKRIIIGGLPRAGSTLVRFMLDRSPTILSGPEIGLLTRPLWQWQQRPEAKSRRIGAKLEIDPQGVRRVLEEATSLLGAYDGVMAAYRDKVGSEKDVWADKYPPNCFGYHLLAAEDPDALFVSTLRDGLDVVTSVIEDHERRSGYWCSIQRYIDSLRAVYAFDSPRHLILRYESLVQEPKRTAGGSPSSSKTSRRVIGSDARATGCRKTGEPPRGVPVHYSVPQRRSRAGTGRFLMNSARLAVLPWTP